jgi:DNA polymerase-1
MIDPELAVQIVRESKVIAFDVETSGLDAGFDFVCGYVITDHSFSIYVPVRHQSGGNIPDALGFELALASAFRERSRLKLRTVGHNVGFDLRFAGWHGVIVDGVVEDTMINEALIDDRTTSYSLSDCAIRHGVTAKKGSDLYLALASKFGGVPDKNQMKNFWKMSGDDPVVVDYAVGDGTTTLELWGKQQHLLDAEELRVPWKLECDLIPYIARMHLRGLKIDGVYASSVDLNVSAQIQEAKSAFSAGFNVRSPKEVETLYRTNGYSDADFARTDTGLPSFTEKWLETNEIGEAILNVRRLEKARGSFIEPLTNTKNISGRVHAVLNQSKSDDYGVAGARLSCSEPNMQAFPKRNKMVGKIVRRLVIPDDGFVLEEADAMQQEPRFFTHYSEEPSLLEGYRNGTFDIHDRASELLGLERDIAKRLGLGMLTMMSPKALSGHMRWDLSRAKAAHAAFLTDAFPMIGAFQQQVVNVYRSRGYVKSILGRKARILDRRFAYQGVSRVIQNSGGDHIKTCILRACQYEDAFPNSVQMLMSIHDSLIWQRDPSHSPVELVKLLENVPYEPQFNLLVPIPFELGSGANWSDASYGTKLKDKKGWSDANW